MKTKLNNKKVVLGLSGGVDSAVAAYLLREDGYDVTGIFLRNWTEDDESGACSARADREDAMRVAAKLGLDFKTVDYEKEYRERVFAPFVAGLNAGLNPNPDILCNPLVKFAALTAVADELGAAWIATGHYARKINNALAAGADKEKDQSYFLSRINKEQLDRTLFPLGEMTKTEVRALAKKIGLPVAEKEGTSGICFIGERNFEKFMKNRVSSIPGPIITVDGKNVGEHRGLAFYTIGQRHGFGYPAAAGEGADGSQPYYVAEKRAHDNTLVIAPAYDPSLFRSETILIEPHWIGGAPTLPLSCLVRVRYRAALRPAEILPIPGKNDKLKLIFSEPERAITPGQYAAFYTGEICLGSAVISQ